MIELNLLPDIKLEYLKSERQRRLVLTLSILITAAAVLILVLLLLVDFAQKKHLSDINSDISSETSTLENKPDISKILTVQNQLESLTALHAAKPQASLLLTNYLDEVTPTNVAINDLQIDFNAHTMTITGTADSIATINKYVDTLKFATYTTTDDSTATNAFTDVVLSDFSTTGGNIAKPASYTINLSFDPTIFDITKSVSLKVPSQVTTRSEIAQPGDLFQANSTKPSAAGAQ